MKNGKFRLLCLALLWCCGMAALGVRPAAAATVYCTAHAPFGDYVAYLFRTGDPWPTATSSVFRISDGGKVVSFSGISGGSRYFIRVTNVSQESGVVTGQTADGYLRYYFSTPLYLGDCWVN